MKDPSFSRVKFFFMVMVMVAFFIPIHLSAQEARYPWQRQKESAKYTGYYLGFKPGIYSPQASDLKDSDFHTGFNGEIAVGFRASPNLAMEMASGYFHTEANESGSGQIGDISFSGEAKAKIDVIPATLTLKVILPSRRFELFGFGGIGGYWVFGDLKASGTIDGYYGSVKLNDNAWIFGGHLGLGFHYIITPTIFIGAEGKYLWTRKAKLQEEAYGVPLEAKFKMDGIVGTAVIGFRF